MKKIFSIGFFMLFVSVSVCAQTNYQDVVYLTNGSIIRGVIVEQIPNKSIKIETADGEVFIFQMEDVEKIAKEKVVVPVKQEPQYVPVQQQQTSAPLPKYTYMFGQPIRPYGDEKSPFLAGFLSFLIPGVGQWYCGDTGAGWMFFGGDIALSSLLLSTAKIYQTPNSVEIQFNGFVVLLDLAWWICSIVDASSQAKRVNKARGFALGNGMYLNVQPSMLQNKDFSLMPTKNSSYGMSFNLNF